MDVGGRGRIRMTKNKKKPIIIHSHSGYTENSKSTKEYKLVIKTADSVFNSPSTAKPIRSRRK
jgi:hypothetical protein